MLDAYTMRSPKYLPSILPSAASKRCMAVVALQQPWKTMDQKPARSPRDPESPIFDKVTPNNDDWLYRCLLSPILWKLDHPLYPDTSPVAPC